jgi:glucosamine kinase
MVEYLIGVDGGGTGTRVRIERADGSELGRGSAGPSGLMHGAGKAWAAIQEAINDAFVNAGVMPPAPATLAVGLGLAGVINGQWAAEFIETNPGFGVIKVETDAFCSLLGAHLGKPGAIIAVGTGIIGEALLNDGTRREVSGWGFPAGDDGSGAWLGLHAIIHAQHALDGRRRPSAFTSAIVSASGGNRDGMFNWLYTANQTAYAQLAPIVIALAAQDDVAHALMVRAGQEIAEIAAALDPAGQLPIAMAGGLAAPMNEYLPQQMRDRVVTPQADAISGALQLIHGHFAK